MNKGEWTAYEETIQQYFVANGVTGAETAGQSDRRKVAIFFTLLGPCTYGLVAPAKTAFKTYQETYEGLVQTLRNRC